MAIGTHGVINLTKAMAWDVDALNASGVYTTADIDNGTFVTASGVQKDSNNNVTGYEFTLALPVANATGLWVVKSPAVGAGISNIYNDPTQFTNPAGSPVSLAKLMAGIDYIEVNAACYTANALPTATAGAFASVDTNGGLVAAAQAPASGTYFSFVGFHTIDIGTTAMPTIILKCERN